MNMRSLYKFHLLSIAAFIFGCAGNTPKADTTTQATIQFKDSPETIFLEGLYATSTELPYSTHSIDNIFDKNEKTFWSTMPGAAPDEGIMFSFSEPISIGAFRLVQPNENEIQHIDDIQVYINGKTCSWELDKDQFFVLKEEEKNKVKSLYIKIAHTEGMESLDEVTQKPFPRFDKVAISEIQFKDNANKLLDIAPPHKIEGTVNCSSFLSPANAYYAAQVFDSRREFAWVEGANGPGVGASLILNSTKGSFSVSSLKIWNGYQRSEDHYNSNARIKSFDFGPFKGPYQTYTLEDKQDPQMIQLKSPLVAEDFELIVKEVYPGTKYEDLGISELRLMSGNSPIIIATNDQEKLQENLLAKVKGTAMENVLDRRLYETSLNYGISQQKHSIIIRSNGTFVLYDYTDEVIKGNTKNKTQELIGDGNWELLMLDADKAVIKVFGKLSNLSEIFQFYQGKGRKQDITIFSDQITIDRKTLKGQKFVDEFTIPQ